jgi:hypothetical protein
VAAPELSASEVAFLEAMKRRNVRFLVVGLSAAALQGAPVVTQDVDLWFENLHDPNLRDALRDVGASYVPPISLNPPMLAGGGLELFDIVLRMDGLERFEQEFNRNIQLPLATTTVPVLPLDRILQSKRAANRLKDKLVIPVLEDTIRSRGV